MRGERFRRSSASRIRPRYEKLGLIALSGSERSHCKEAERKGERVRGIMGWVWASEGGGRVRVLGWAGVGVYRGVFKGYRVVKDELGD